MNGGQVMRPSRRRGIQCVINGEMDILANTPFYDDSANDAGYTINAFLTGGGQIEYHDLGYVMAMEHPEHHRQHQCLRGTWNVVQERFWEAGPMLWEPTP